jgi:hypothetical protein
MKKKEESTKLFFGEYENKNLIAADKARSYFFSKAVQLVPALLTDLQSPALDLYSAMQVEDISEIETRGLESQLNKSILAWGKKWRLISPKITVDSLHNNPYTRMALKIVATNWQRNIKSNEYKDYEGMSYIVENWDGREPFEAWPENAESFTTTFYWLSNPDPNKSSNLTIEERTISVNFCWNVHIQTSAQFIDSIKNGFQTNKQTHNKRGYKRANFSSWLKEQLDEIEKLAKAKGLTKPKRRQVEQVHFEWIIRYQIQNWSLGKIKKDYYKEYKKSVTPQAINDAIQKLRSWLELPAKKSFSLQ